MATTVAVPPAEQSDSGTVMDVPPLCTPPRTAAAFSFPYATPYGIQLDLMIKLFEAIEHRKVAVFESPTGTGKSLSLICGAFTWLRANEARLRESPRIMRGTEGEGEGDEDEPEWVKQQAVEKRLKDLLRGEEELKARIRIMKKKEAEMRRKAAKVAAERSRSSAAFSVGYKKLKREHHGKVAGDANNMGESDDERFLPNTMGQSLKPSWHTLPILGNPQNDEHDSDNLSPAVRALMAQFSAATSGTPQGDELPETTPKIIYVSRTHTQLSQFVSELRKTTFGRDIDLVDCHVSLEKSVDVENASESVRVIALGSRKQMCINESVQKIGATAGTEAMNESCRELHSSRGSRKRCEHLPLMDELGRSQVLDFRDRALAIVRDIEDLVKIGKDMSVCPYYAARTSARQAQLVTMPYSLLLQKTARKSLGISLKDSVVLIDESHNLIDTILSVHTCVITSTRLTVAKSQITEYLLRFGGKLRGDSEVMLRMLLRLLQGLERLCLRWQQEHKTRAEEVWTASKVVEEMGANLDTVNFGQLEQFLRTTQIAKKVSGYAERCIQRQQQQQQVEQPALKNRSRGQTVAGATSSCAISAMHAIEAFILSLANRTEDGRVLLTSLSPTNSIETWQEAPQYGADGLVQLKYQLLNPSESFRDIVEEARSVILAGGTMEPILDIRRQLFPDISPARWTTHSCSHIVPSANLLCSAVPSGPRGVPFEFKFDRRGDTVAIDDLGHAIANVAAVVPDGIVVFLPSYSFLDEAVGRWQATRLWQRLVGRKNIFTEPRASAEVESVLQAYSAGIGGRTARGLGSAAAGGSSGSLLTGSLLLAVVGAKLSEGINFSDRLARAVVMVGMPFPSSHSAELRERMRHVRSLSKQSTPDAGQELYVNLCMKAVNQSIGRAIRHQNDFAALILLDRRYGRGDILQRLPGWIRGEAKVQPAFGPFVKDLGAFFREKRAKGLI